MAKSKKTAIATTTVTPYYSMEDQQLDVLSAVQKDRRAAMAKIYQDSAGPLREYYERIQIKLQGAEHSRLREIYEIGELMIEVRNHCGHGAGQLMARALGVQNSLLSRAEGIARCFDFEDVEKIIRENPSVGWSHLDALATVDDDKKRNALLEKTLEMQLSSRSIKKLIKLRPHRIESDELRFRSLAGAVSNFHVRTSEFNVYLRDIESHLIPNIEEFDPTEAPPDLLPKVKLVHEDLRQVMIAAKSHTARLESLLEKLVVPDEKTPEPPTTRKKGPAPKRLQRLCSV